MLFILWLLRQAAYRASNANNEINKLDICTFRVAVESSENSLLIMQKMIISLRFLPGELNIFTRVFNLLFTTFYSAFEGKKFSLLRNFFYFPSGRKKNLPVKVQMAKYQSGEKISFWMKLFRCIEGTVLSRFFNCWARQSRGIFCIYI